MNGLMLGNTRYIIHWRRKFHVTPVPYRGTALYETYLLDRVLTKINQFSRILPVLNESDYLGIGLSYDTFSIDFYNPVTFKE